MVLAAEEAAIYDASRRNVAYLYGAERVVHLQALRNVKRDVKGTCSPRLSTDTTAQSDQEIYPMTLGST